jgi:hypothetical protein
MAQSTLRVALLLAVLVSLHASAATFTVNTTQTNADGACDSTHCSLPDAINAAGANSTADTVAFAIGSGPQTINLPFGFGLNSSTTIDGTTQPGYAGQPLIEIKGSMTIFFLISGNQTIRGLTLTAPSGSTPIDIGGSLGTVTIEKNYIGTTASGNAAGGSPSWGIKAQASSTSSMLIRDNVIGGAVDAGIRLESFDGGLITIENNSVGIGADGSTAVPNRFGIYLNEVRNAVVLRGNTIAANTQHGYVTWEGGAQTIEGNYVGVLPDGTARGNRRNGIQISGPEGAVTIGGPVPAQRNVVSSNLAAGISFMRGTSAATTNVVIQGNFIGVAPDGATPRGNGEAGIYLPDPSFIGFDVAHGNTIGGTAPGEGNVIAHNGADGVNVRIGGYGNRIEGNSIYDNAGLAIDLTSNLTTGDGVTPNDAGDVDQGGGNNYQNFPVLTSATTNGTHVTVSGTLASQATRNYRICVYANRAADASMHGEAETFLGCTTVISDASGNASFTLTTPAPPSSPWVCATATDMTTNDTSELSRNVGIIAAGVLQFSVPAVAVAEEAGTVAVQIQRTGGSTGTVAVTVSTANVSAVAGSDYTATSNPITFVHGETAKTVLVPILQDSLDEAAETFTVALTNPVGGATLGALTESVVTILDDDPSPTLRIDDLSVTEGDSGVVSAAFTVTRGGATAQTITVHYATGNGTAGAPDDYTAASGTLTFAPDEATKTIAVSVNGDGVVESSETFTVTLSSPANAAIADAQGVATIVDDDATPSVSIGDATISEGGTAVFAVTLSGASAQTVTVDYATASGPGGTVTFAPYVTTQTVSVATTQDLVDEPDEHFLVSLSNAVNATLGDASGEGTIVDDDGTPQIAIAAASAVESAAVVSLAVSLSNPSASEISVVWSTADDTATAGSDYAAHTAQTLVIPAFSTTAAITVPLLGDDVAETNETFAVQLSAPSSNAAIANGLATATIVDDDGTPQLSVGDATVVEGTAAAFTVTLSHASSAAVSVRWATADETALAPADYAAASGTLDFAPGQTSKSFEVPGAGDEIIEPAERFVVRLSSPANAVLADAEGTGTIVDDDGSPALTVDDVAVTEGSDAIFTVTLSAPTSATVSVHYATANGTASASDYASTTGTLVLAPGVTAATITVATHGDSIIEPNETFLLDLSSPVHAILADASATATITDDDGSATLTIGDASVTEGANLTFTVTLSGTTSQPVTVQFDSVDATATAGSDYAATTGTLTFANGPATQTLTINGIGDALVEGTETFNVVLHDASGATITDPSALGTILDDDTTPEPIPSIAIAGANVVEGHTGTTTATFSVSLSHASSADVTVAYATGNGSATSGADYGAASGNLHFAAGTTTRSIHVSVVGDTLVESSETFTVTLSNPGNATIAAATATGTIVNDDAESPPPPPPPVTRDPRVSLDPGVRVTECTGGAAVEAIFTVRITPRPDDRIVVHYATTPGSATAGADFEPVNDTLFVKKGQSTATIAVPVRCDSEDEPEETFLLTLNEASGGEIRGPVALATIVDDDIALGRTRAIATVIGATAGAQGSQFRTALRLFNSTDRPVRGLIVLHPAGRAASEGDPSVPYALHAGESRLFADVMQDAGLQGLASADLVALEGTVPTAFIRVYNDGGANGSTGFASQELIPGDALQTGDTAALFVPADLHAFRFNAGMRSLDAGATFEVEVLDAAGQPRSRTSRSIPPNFFLQTSGNDFAGTTLAGGDTIRLTVRAGQLIAYGATIDNITNDPSVQFARKDN